MAESGSHIPLGDALRIDPAQTAAHIEEFIRGAVSDYQRDGALLGLSGGIDSAVVATLAARALGADRVKGLLLPERDSSASSKADALVEIARLGITYREVSITPMLSALGIYDLLPLQILGHPADQVGRGSPAVRQASRGAGRDPVPGRPAGHP
jgi:NAD+ synthase